MDDKPMLNTPAETGVAAGEAFEQSKMARLDRLRAEMNITSLALPEAEKARLEQFKQETFARFEEITGLTFDRDTGKCTTPGKVRMEGEFKERWTALASTGTLLLRCGLTPIGACLGIWRSKKF
jgi:hypothetical protein